MKDFVKVKRESKINQIAELLKQPKETKMLAKYMLL